MAKRSSKGKVSISLYQWMMFWLLVLCSVALVCAIFGRVDVRTLNNTSRLAAMETIVSNCENKLRLCENNVDNLKESNIELSRQLNNSVPLRGTSGYYDLDQECYSDDPGPADEYILYVDKDKSVQMQLPYSSSWGTARCPPVQIYNNDDGISFGPSVAGEGGEARDSGLSIQRPSSTSEITARIKDELSESEDPDAPIRQRLVNGLTVFSYTQNFGLGSLNRWVAVGRNYVYTISSVRWLTDAEAIKLIQSLRVTK